MTDGNHEELKSDGSGDGADDNQNDNSQGKDILYWSPMKIMRMNAMTSLKMFMMQLLIS